MPAEKEVSVIKGHGREKKGEQPEDKVKNPLSSSARLELEVGLRKESSNPEKEHESHHYLRNHPYHAVSNPFNRTAAAKWLCPAMFFGKPHKEGMVFIIHDGVLCK